LIKIYFLTKLEIIRNIYDEYNLVRDQFERSCEKIYIEKVGRVKLEQGYEY
jgi:hypothetical protein